MTPYRAVLDLAREQTAAVSRGDLAAAMRLLEDRSALLAGAPAPGPGDNATIAEILRLDRIVAGALRTGMLSIRDEVVALHRGADALMGYQAAPTDARRTIDSRV